VDSDSTAIVSVGGDSVYSEDCEGVGYVEVEVVAVLRLLLSLGSSNAAQKLEGPKNPVEKTDFLNRAVSLLPLSGTVWLRSVSSVA
jgi:hypothetical protein